MPEGVNSSQVPAGRYQHLSSLPPRGTSVGLSFCQGLQPPQSPFQGLLLPGGLPPSLPPTQPWKEVPAPKWPRRQPPGSHALPAVDPVTGKRKCCSHLPLLPVLLLGWKNKLFRGGGAHPLGGVQGPLGQGPLKSTHLPSSHEVGNPVNSRRRGVWGGMEELWCYQRPGR